MVYAAAEQTLCRLAAGAAGTLKPGGWAGMRLLDKSDMKSIDCAGGAAGTLERGSWAGMRTVADLRRALGVGAPRDRDSLYAPIDRAPRQFNPLRIPKKLQARCPSGCAHQHLMTACVAGTQADSRPAACALHLSRTCYLCLKLHTLMLPGPKVPEAA